MELEGEIVGRMQHYLLEISQTSSRTGAGGKDYGHSGANGAIFIVAYDVLQNRNSFGNKFVKRLSLESGQAFLEQNQYNLEKIARCIRVDRRQGKLYLVEKGEEEDHDAGLDASMHRRDSSSKACCGRGSHSGFLVSP